MKYLLCFAILFSVLPCAPAHATATTCACTQAALTAAITGAANGDTVLCSPSGQSATWNSAVSIPNTKGITLDGNGATVSGQINLGQNANSSSRITRFNFTVINAVNTGGSKTSAPFRIDHCDFTVTAGGSTLLNVGSGNAPGLVDHNSFNAPQNSEIIHNWGMGASDASGWSDDIIPGGPGAVYLEDNSFTNNGVSGNPAYFWGNSSVQAYYGSRTVFRHNTLFMSQIDQHGTPGMIGVRWWEIYENTFSTDFPNASQCCFVSLRAGSGVVFNNHHTGANLNGNSIDLYEEDTGYPALYQIGRGRNQVSDPAYVWGNDAFFGVGSQTPGMVQVNRDYFLSPKPGYTPFVYPYPLTANGLPDPLGGAPVDEPAILKMISGQCAVFTIYNLRGQMVRRSLGEFRGAISGFRGLADMERGLPDGIYLYRVSVGGAHYTVKKIVIR
jgi:hypothetical protein